MVVTLTLRTIADQPKMYDTLMDVTRPEGPRHQPGTALSVDLVGGTARAGPLAANERGSS
jgi:hypothetical protein